MTIISVILVSGGQPWNIAGTTAELLYTSGSRICFLPDLPSLRRRHSQTGVTVCGGVDSPANATCHTLSATGTWIQSHNLAQDRRYHSAWRSPQGTILIGGRDSGAGTTSVILLESGDTNPGFNLIDKTR